MRRRIFIAINLPEEIKKQLIDYQNKWLDLPCRWTKKENLHITLFFLGYLTDQELVEVLKIAKEVTQRIQPFSIDLIKICYGPPHQKKPPRMVWAMGENSEELGKLRKDLETFLLSSVALAKEDINEKRGYTSHITLGRIKQWEFKRIDPKERPVVDVDISLSFEVNSIEVMESQLKPRGSEYTILESLPLGVSKL